MTRPYPWYYAVNDRPVKVVELADGGADVLVFDWATGAFTPDRSYWEQLSSTGKDVDQLTESQFDVRVGLLRQPIVEKHVTSSIAWESAGDGELPYRASVDGHVYTIRVNDFPEEPLYTLLVDGQEIVDLDDWPAAWIKPNAHDTPGKPRASV